MTKSKKTTRSLKGEELKRFQFQTDNAIRASRGIKKLSWKKYCDALSIVPETTSHRISGTYNNDDDNDAIFYTMIMENAKRYGYYNH